MGAPRAPSGDTLDVGLREAAPRKHRSSLNMILILEAHHGLEVEEGLKPSLRDLSLVRRVRGVPSGVLQHVPQDHGGHRCFAVSHANEVFHHLEEGCRRGLGSARDRKVFRGERLKLRTFPTWCAAVGPEDYRKTLEKRFERFIDEKKARNEMHEDAWYGKPRQHVGQ